MQVRRRGRFSFLFTRLLHSLTFLSSGCAEGGQYDIWSIFVMVSAVGVLLVMFSVGNFVSGLLCSCNTFSGKSIGSKLWAIFCFFAWGGICWFCKNWREPPIWQGDWQAMYRLLILFLGSVAAVSLSFVCALICRGVKSTYHVFVPGAIATVTMGVGAWFPEEINEDCVGENGRGEPTPLNDNYLL